MIWVNTGDALPPKNSDVLFFVVEYLDKTLESEFNSYFCVGFMDDNDSYYLSTGDDPIFIEHDNTRVIAWALLPHQDRLLKDWI